MRVERKNGCESRIMYEEQAMSCSWMITSDQYMQNKVKSTGVMLAVRAGVFALLLLLSGVV